MSTTLRNCGIIFASVLLAVATVRCAGQSSSTGSASAASATQPAASAAPTLTPQEATVEITREQLVDRIAGGWLGQMIGGLEGLPHEFKYIDQPRADLPDFTCGLPKGGVTDDDTDIEWVHLYYMDREGTLKVPYTRIREIWAHDMVKGVWVANEAAANLMRKGMLPPATGQIQNNPHSGYNLSGQFCVESYGMISPGMPQAAADLGLHYAHIAVAGEPTQATQFWTGVIALAPFQKGSLEELLTLGLKAADERSAIHEAIRDAIEFHRAHPGAEDWKAARQLFHKKWVVQRKWNKNSTPTNGGAVALALLYGNGDYYKTMQYAFAIGYDADCDAATAGAVLGVRLGRTGLDKIPGFTVEDKYVNKTRPSLPPEVKISEQVEQMARLAEKVILANGGEKSTRDGQVVYRIKLQEPKLLEPLPADTTTSPAVAPH